MEQKKNQIKDFIQKEHFELSSYVSHLFDHYKNRFKDEKIQKKSCQQLNLEQTS